uniref:Uncharacterized protein n=1 Tax=Romanomermis culicivorax TaxID=13658 RepID=A0A915JVG0_ROMCU
MYDWVHPKFAANWHLEIPDRPSIAFCNLLTLISIMICAFRSDPKHQSAVPLAFRMSEFQLEKHFRKKQDYRIVTWIWVRKKQIQ